jgi:hypothetical protein
MTTESALPVLGVSMWPVGANQPMSQKIAIATIRRKRQFQPRRGRPMGIGAGLMVIAIRKRLPRYVFFTVLLLLRLGSTSAHSCALVGPRYLLKSDIVDWSMEISIGQNCIQGFRLGNVILEDVKLISPPQFGQLTFHGPGVSYKAGLDFQGHDSFTVVVSGKIDRIRGSSTIHVVISSTGQLQVRSPTLGGDHEQCAGDGRDGASKLPIQHPNLLRVYVLRSPCHVAGVDYAVGPQQIPTKDPATISMAGVSVDKSTRTVIITGNNVTLDGYDFSSQGGYQVYISGANDTISNSNFVLGSNTGGYLIDGGSSASKLTISNNTMDASSGGNETSLIGFAGSGAIILENNWFKNFPQHVLELIQGPGTTFSVVYKYNLIENGGVLPAHLNYLQFGGGHATSVDVEYNTGYQTNLSGGETFQFYNNAGGSIDNSTLAYNTTIASGGPQGSHMGYLIHGGYNPTYSSANPGTAHNNYFDSSASWGPFYLGSFKGWTLFSNYNMVTGMPLTNKP